MMAANKAGIAAKNSAWLGVKLYHLIKNGPRAANIPHIPKPREKATNAIPILGSCPQVRYQAVCLYYQICSYPFIVL